MDEQDRSDEQPPAPQEHLYERSGTVPDYEEQFDYRDNYDSLTIAVAEGISDVKDVPVTEIVPPLSDVVDPGALEQIFRPLPDGEARAGWVTFFIHNCKVIVSSDGWLRIFDLEDDSRYERELDR